MDEITLRHERRARVVVGRGSLEKLPDTVGQLDPHRILAIADSRVGDERLSNIEESLRGQGYSVHLIKVAGGEQVKTLAFIARLWRLMAKLGLTRDSLVIGIGGGTLLDAAGFAASTYMRGCKLAYVPTTTLAQADAAIGGKTGINLGGRNVVGTIYHADLVIIDTSFLDSLSYSDYISGFSEVVKHAVIKGYRWIEFLEDRLDGIKSRDPRVVDEVIRFSVKTKMDIIASDYLEKGLRTILNFGHTVAHALEAATDYKIGHGQAVSIGVHIESLIANRLLGFPLSDVERITSILEALGLPVKLPVDASLLLAHMRHDKKFTRGEPRLPLPRRIGEFEIVTLSWGELASCLREIASP